MMRNPRITNDPDTPTHSLIFKKLGVLLNDADMVSTRSWNANPIQVPIGQVTRARRAKKFHNALNGVIQRKKTQTKKNAKQETVKKNASNTDYER